MDSNKVKEILCKQIELLAEVSQSVGSQCDLAGISASMAKISKELRLLGL